jgi:hypothetical protein
MAGQADAGSAQSRSHESAAKAGHSTQVAAGGTAARRRGELAYAAEDLDPSDRGRHDTSVKAAHDLGPES